MMQLHSCRHLLALTVALGMVACAEDQTEMEPPTGSSTQSVDMTDLISVPLEDRHIVVLTDEVYAQIQGDTYDERVEEVRTIALNLLDHYGLPDLVPGQVYGSALAGFTVPATLDLLTPLQDAPEVAYIEPDRTLGFDPLPLLGSPFGQPAPPAQEVPWGLERVGGASGEGRTAWIIDTGIDFDHPDLVVDTDRSRNFAGFGSADDDNGHGTHVAGTVAARNNDIGSLGVAWDATVVAVKVLDSSGRGFTSDVIAGVDYVAQAADPGDAANLSLSGGPSDALDQAVVSLGMQGVYVALAAGNSGEDANGYSPSRANGPNVYTVSAFDRDDRLAGFSNYGNPPVDFAEPGVEIRSTWLDGGYRTLSGTSMAAPHLCAILLLTGGSPDGDGTVSGDPDGEPDTIGILPDATAERDAQQVN